MLRLLVLAICLGPASFAKAQELAATPPTKLLIKVGGFNGPSYLVELIPGSSSVRYRHNPDTFTEAGDGSTREEIIEIPRNRWITFWLRLEEAKVWKWKDRYELSNKGPDGTVWSVDVRWNGRSADSFGYNAYPPQFRMLKEAVVELIGGKLFE